MNYLSTTIILFTTFFATLNAQVDSTKLFIFGNSTIDHRPPAVPTPSNETTVPHWIYLLAQENNEGFAAGGQYGFLPQHRNVPPIAQWGYDIVPGVWDSDNEPFSDADITTVMITGANFIQWQAPYLDYPSDPGITPISATEDIVDWLVLQEDSLKIYVYENWPDMAPFLNNGFPPNAAEFLNFNNYTNAGFHDWWIEYQDSLLLSRPDINVRMIPVGPILASLALDTFLNQTPITELYEDDAPHGRASLYFLAALTSYMAIYEKPAPIGYNVPSIVHPDIINNYENIVNYIWDYLKNFNDNNGTSRVFYGTLTNAFDAELASDNISLYPNPTEGFFQIDGLIMDYNIDVIDINGNVHQSYTGNLPSIYIDIENLPTGSYFIKIENTNNGQVRLEKILKLN